MPADLDRGLAEAQKAFDAASDKLVAALAKKVLKRKPRKHELFACLGMADGLDFTLQVTAATVGADGGIAIAESDAVAVAALPAVDAVFERLARADDSEAFGRAFNPAYDAFILRNLRRAWREAAGKDASPLYLEFHDSGHGYFDLLSEAELGLDGILARAGLVPALPAAATAALDRVSAALAEQDAIFAHAAEKAKAAALAVLRRAHTAAETSGDADLLGGIFDAITAVEDGRLDRPFSR